MAKRQIVERLVVYVVHSGDGGGSYGSVAQYDDWEACLHDVKEALDADREILISRELMTEAEYINSGAELEGNPLI